MQEKLVTAVFNILNQTNHPIGGDIAQQIRDAILNEMRQNLDQRVIAERFEHYPTETAALFKLELAKLLANKPDFAAMLQKMVVRFETAVSTSPSSTQAAVSGSGTVVQGDNNVVIGAGATYIENSNINLSPDDVELEASINAFPEMAQLRKLMIEYFNLDDMQNLCWDLGIAYEEFGDGGISAKVRELLGHCIRNGRIPDLLDYCRKERGHVEWPTLS